MKRSELIIELKDCERRLALLNDEFQAKRGPRPSEADPATCARRKELRKMLVERLYEDDPYYRKISTGGSGSGSAA